jgi:hypothetical protein
LQELKVQDGDVSYLAPEYQSLLDQEEKQAALQRQQLLQPGSTTKAGTAAAAAGGTGGLARGTWQQQQDQAAAEAELEAALEAVRQLFRDYGRLSSGAGPGLVKQKMAGLEGRLRAGGEEGGLEAVLEYMTVP